MRQSRAWSLALISSILFSLFLIACGGGKKAASVGPPAKVTLSPASVSLTAGDVLQLQVSVLDAQNRSVFNQAITFTSDRPNEVQVGNNGSLCAGTWQDANHQPSLTSPIICIPAAPTAAGIPVNITATAGGITSNSVPVFVHLKVTKINVTPVAPACVTQGGTVPFTAQAFSDTTDITASVGDINWQVVSGQVASASPITTPGSAPATTVTAKLPGKSQVTAVVNNINPVNSLPAFFTECPVARIDIAPPSPPPTHLNTAGATVQMTATVVDTTGATVATVPTLTWASNPAAVATVSATGLVTAQVPGTDSVVAGCIPNTCNVNLEPTYSNLATVIVDGTSSTTVYAAAKDSSSLVPISTGTNTAGTALTLPNNQLPNSLVFSPTGGRAFLGSTAGLMVVDATNNSFASTITQAPGEALVVSPDGTQIIVADRSAKLLRFFNSTANTVTNFPAALDANVAPAAKFSPDGTRAYIVSGAKLFVFQSGAVSTLTLAASATDVGFLANGNAAYLANSTTSRILSCDNSIANGPGGAPTFVGSLPNGTQILGAESDKINAIDVTVNPAALNSSSACPSVTENLVPHGIPAGAPEQLIVTPDSTKAFVTSRARTGSLVAYDVGANAAAGTPGTITLAGAMAATAGTTTGGTTLDSKTLYVGATDNAVHVIDISAGTDAAQVPVPFTPDFVAVRPH